MRAPRLPREVRAWGLVSLFSDLTHETVTAAMPALLAGFGAPPAALGLVEGVSDGVATVAKLAGGRLADRLRRLKPAAAAGYVLTALAMPAVALARSWLAVLLLRAIGWVGRGFRSPLRDTLLSRAAPPAFRGRAFGLERAMDQVGAVAAPLLLAGLALAGGSPRLAVAWSVVPGIACLALLMTCVREHPLPASGASAGGAAAGERGADPPQRLPAPCRRVLAAVAVFGCGDFAKTLFVLWALGARPDLSPAGMLSRGALLYAAFTAVTVVAAWLGGRASDRVGRGPVLVSAYAVGAAAALAPLLAPPSVLAAVAALVASGWLVGVEEAVEKAWIADASPPQWRGRAFGWLHALNGAGDLVASAGVGLLWTAVSPKAAFGAAAAVMGAGALLAARAARLRG